MNCQEAKPYSKADILGIISGTGFSFLLSFSGKSKIIEFFRKDTKSDHFPATDKS